MDNTQKEHTASFRITKFEKCRKYTITTYETFRGYTLLLNIGNNQNILIAPD